MSVTWKPVAKMIVSTSCSVPSARTTRPGPHLGQPGGDEVDVGLRQRRQVVVGDQDPLAADAVVGRQPRPQGRIGHRPGKVPAGQPFGGPHQPGATTKPATICSRPQ